MGYAVCQGDMTTSGVRTWGDSLFTEARFLGFAFWLPSPSLLKASTGQLAIDLWCWEQIFFTRQFIHSSLTRKINKVTVVLQRREETGLKYRDYKRVSALQTLHAQRFTLPPLSFSLATHNLSCARSPVGPSCWTPELWQRRTAIHSAVSHLAAANPITCNYSNTRRKTSIVYKTLKGNKPHNAGHLKWELRVTGKIQMQYLDFKKEKKKINQYALPRHFTSNWRVNCVYLPARVLDCLSANESWLHYIEFSIWLSYDPIGLDSVEIPHFKTHM